MIDIWFPTAENRSDRDRSSRAMVLGNFPPCLGNCKARAWCACSRYR